MQILSAHLSDEPTADVRVDYEDIDLIHDALTHYERILADFIAEAEAANKDPDELNEERGNKFPGPLVKHQEAISDLVNEFTEAGVLVGYYKEDELGK